MSDSDKNHHCAECKYMATYVRDSYLFSYYKHIGDGWYRFFSDGHRGYTEWYCCETPLEEAKCGTGGSHLCDRIQPCEGCSNCLPPVQVNGFRWI